MGSARGLAPTEVLILGCGVDTGGNIPMEGPSQEPAIAPKRRVFPSGTEVAELTPFLCERQAQHTMSLGFLQTKKNKKIAFPCRFFLQES